MAGTCSFGRPSSRARWCSLPEDSTYPRDWALLAARDWERVERMLRDEDPAAAGFFLQQAVEKYLKAFLLLHGRPLRRVHDLGALLDDAVTLEPGLEAARSACLGISNYYILDRYPQVLSGAVSTDEVKASLTAVRGLVDRIREQVDPSKGGQTRTSST